MNEGTTQAWFSTVIKQRDEEKYVFTAAQYFIPFHCCNLMDFCWTAAKYTNNCIFRDTLYATAQKVHRWLKTKLNSINFHSQHKRDCHSPCDTIFIRSFPAFSTSFNSIREWICGHEKFTFKWRVDWLVVFVIPKSPDIDLIKSNQKNAKQTVGDLSTRGVDTLWWCNENRKGEKNSRNSIWLEIATFHLQHVAKETKGRQS